MTIMLIHHQLLSQNENNITIPSIQNSINQDRSQNEKMQRTNSYYKKYANKNINPLQSTKNKNKYASNLSNEYKAMRYYKIWIYTCNIALFISIVGFVVISFKIIINNYKRKLIVDFHLLQPSLLYIYIALFIQCSFLQIIGYFGAKKLNIKLLNFYWLLILLLLINDIIFGIIFLYNYNILITNLNFKLKSQLKLYAAGKNSDPGAPGGEGAEFIELWQQLQAEYKCCGVENFIDFYNVNITGAAAVSEPTLSFGTMTTYPPDDLLEDPPTTLHFPEDLLVAPSDDRIHNQDSVRILLPNSCCKRAPPTAPTNVGSPNVGSPRNVGAPTNLGSTNVGGAAALHNY
ncbi:uncharacterized protein LOC103518943, partial [Diaphorina citri]|uniref:Uncharacterized protein LOC103518943 n=1 Tax=Diaphorina citri TaxID=121845 RepID=A0A1S3DI56_DIACI